MVMFLKRCGMILVPRDFSRHTYTLTFSTPLVVIYWVLQLCMHLHSAVSYTPLAQLLDMNSSGLLGIFVKISLFYCKIQWGEISIGRVNIFIGKYISN